MIHDRSPELFLNYREYSIKEVVISLSSPNMSAVAERFPGAVRREALNWFIIFSERPLNNILKEYIRCCNHFRPNQGIDQNVPCGYLTKDYTENPSLFCESRVDKMGEYFVREVIRFFL